MPSKVLIFILRISMGWMYFYAGITKILNPDWSAAGFLQNAKSLEGLYQWFASPSVLPIINIVNEWALFLLGVSLLLGIFVRASTFLGALLMVLYYIPNLTFPYVGTTSFLIDQHIIYILALLLLGNIHAGRFWGLENWCSRLPICSRYPVLRKMLG